MEKLGNILKLILGILTLGLIGGVYKKVKDGERAEAELTAHKQQEEVKNEIEKNHEANNSAPVDDLIAKNNARYRNDPKG